MASTRAHDLPDAAAHNVLRYLSSSPSALNWVSFVSPEDALTAVHPSSARRSAARESFTRVSTTPAKLGEGAAVHLPNDEDPALLKRWFKCAAGFLVGLTLDGGLDNLLPGELVPKMAALEENCHALRELDISRICSTLSGPAPADFLMATRGRLTDLAAGCGYARETQQCGVGLRKISLDDIPSDFEGLLRATGPTLESFECNLICPRNAMEYLRKFCPKLSTIILLIMGNQDGQAYADLLCSYGPQLRCACLDQASVPFCNQVVASCPNLRCDLYMDEDDSENGWTDDDCEAILPKMKVLGSCLKELEVRFQHLQGVEIMAPSSGCFCHLETLRLEVDDNDGLQMAEHLFSCDMPLLTSLELDLGAELDSDLQPKIANDLRLNFLAFMSEYFATSILI